MKRAVCRGRVLAHSGWHTLHLAMYARLSSSRDVKLGCTPRTSYKDGVCVINWMADNAGSVCVEEEVSASNE